RANVDQIYMSWLKNLDPAGFGNFAENTPEASKNAIQAMKSCMRCATNKLHNSAWLWMDHLCYTQSHHPPPQAEQITFDMNWRKERCHLSCLKLTEDYN
ncbi:hypothetical protein KI387_019844, partial [Taxus chinensis]